MLPADAGEALLGALPHGRVYQAVTGWERDLATLRSRGHSVLEGLSSNTRAQVRRSIRRYEARDGALSLRRAQSLAEAREAWELAGTWHRARWPDSGFNNPQFMNFHATLLKRGFDHGAVRLYRVAFGDETIAVCHYLCEGGALGEGGTVRFYLQGVRPEADGHLKPGLTAHCVLMQHFLDEGWDSYDFMGGDSRYKRQLADRRREFLSLRVHDGSARQRLRDVARALRTRLNARTTRP
jgi:CelD/BcsL family acetyltransferase involved in cellulose biosynthesis